VKERADLVFMAGVYLDNVAGATFVKLGRCTVYFYNSKIVGVLVGDVIYRCIENRRNPSHHKRVKQALHERNGIKTGYDVSEQELKEKAGDAVLMLASKLIDARLRGDDT